MVGEEDFTFVLVSLKLFDLIAAWYGLCEVEERVVKPHTHLEQPVVPHKLVW